VRKLSVALLLGGCQKKVGGQVVAVVNGDEITQQELNAELQAANVPASADKNQVRSQLLQRIVERKLLVQQAKKDGLDQTPAYLVQVRQAQDNAIIGLLAQKLSKSISLPDGAAVDKFVAQNSTMFAARKRYALDQIAFPIPEDPKLLKEFEPAHSLAAIETVLKSHNIQFAQGKGQLDSAQVPPEMATRIASLPAGEPFLVPDKGRMIASVITAVQTTPTPSEQSKPAALNALRQQALGDAMRKQLEKARASAKIEYQAGLEPKK
jgi:peptidyl-prolyl cis-trans isomerase C